MCTSVFITILVLIFVIIIGYFAVHEIAKNAKAEEDKYPYGWTKVVKTANNDYMVVRWKYPDWDWEGYTKIDWQEGYIYATLEEAIAKSNEINDKIDYEKKSRIWKDV